MTRTEEAKAIQTHERLIRFAAQPFMQLGVAAEDLMQEGRLAFLLALRSFDPSRGVAVWTYARRFVMGAMFAAVGRALVMPLAERDECEDSADDATSPDDARLVSELLATLSPEERQIVTCYFVGDATLQELAAVTGLSMRGVHHVRDAALAKMRAHADEAA